MTRAIRDPVEICSIAPRKADFFGGTNHSDAASSFSRVARSIGIAILPSLPTLPGFCIMHPMFTRRILILIGFCLLLSWPIGAVAENNSPDLVNPRPEIQQDTTNLQHTDLAFINLGLGLEQLTYQEFLDTLPAHSLGITGGVLASSDIVIRLGQLGLLARGDLTLLDLFGREQFSSSRSVFGGDVFQKNDLDYRLSRAVIGAGLVLSNGFEPYVGYWQAYGKQTRKDFSPPDPLRPNLVSIERVKSRGLVLGFQGVSYDKKAEKLIHFYGDLIIPVRTTTTNSVIPGVKLHSWGIGLEGGASVGKTYGKGPGKILVSLQGNFIALYYDGQVRRDVPGFTFVEWPSNLTTGWSLVLQFGGGWFSVGE